MRTKIIALALATPLALLATLAAESDALACGGCFHPPTENPTVVTDHRMILSVAKDQSTLYDQIEYSGSPSAFAWVLPIAGTVKIGLSSDAVFQALDARTQTSIVAPPLNCPAPPDDCNARNKSAGTPTSFGEDDEANGSGGGVQVIERQVVGPYDTVQLAASDPDALAKWLTDNGFAITDAEKPVVAAYVAEHFDFLAVKLLPTEGVASMRPIRVTTTGPNVALPLRMVAAGAGPKLGITLWIIGEGRYQPTNFDSFVIKADDLQWDWTTQSSNYTQLRADKTAAGGGKIWELESTMTVQASGLLATIRSYDYDGKSYQAVYGPADADAGNGDAGSVIVQTATQARDEDLATLVYGVPNDNARVTRIRADLTHDALATDLVLGATADQTEVSNVRQVAHEANEPLCPVYSGCDVVGNAPRGQAKSQTDANNQSSGESFSCMASRKLSRVPTPAWIGSGALVLGLVAGKLSRRNKARK